MFNFQTRAIVRCQAIITQLTFEHALRIRMIADVPTTTVAEDDESVADSTEEAEADGSATEAEASTDGGAASDAQSEATTLKADSSTAASSKSKAKALPSLPIGKETKNLIGKINNLVTSDTQNITRGLHTIREIIYTPLKIILCIVFLYAVLGWR